MIPATVALLAVLLPAETAKANLDRPVSVYLTVTVTF